MPRLSLYGRDNGTPIPMPQREDVQNNGRGDGKDPEAGKETQIPQEVATGSCHIIHTESSGHQKTKIFLSSADTFYLARIPYMILQVTFIL